MHSSFILCSPRFPTLAPVVHLIEIGAVKTLRYLLLLVGLTLVTASARADLNWQTDFKKAQEEAKAGNKLLFVDFTGSDWCGWCIRLDREVFSKPEFKEYADKNLILLEVDFPRRKAQPDDLKRQNQQLANQYGIEGFPTIVVLNGEGKMVGELGYMEGGPTAFIAQLERLRKG